MDLTSLNKDRKNRRTGIDMSTMVYGRVPPQAKELEEAILGGILISPECLSEVLNLVFTEVFYVEAHQIIFKAILSLYDQSKKVDILTVVEELKRMESLDMVGGPYYVTKLTNSVVSTANIDNHCRIVMEVYLKREMIRISGEAIGDAYEDNTDAFDLYDRTDNQILNTQERVLSGSVKNMSHYSAKVYDQYETVKQTGVLGIQTGIVPFDRILSGLVSPDLFIIAARPSQGKTALAMSLSHHISVVNGIEGAWFSLEMDGVQLTRRLASIDSGISHELIRQGRIPKEQEIKFYNSLDRIAKAPIYIEDKGSMNIRSIRTRSNILVRKNKIKYIVVDYLQLMEAVDKRDTNRNNIVGEITRGLKMLAKELNIPVIALSQLSRKVEERSDKMPQMSDLRESGNIEQDADEILFLMRPEKYGLMEPVSIGGKEYEAQGLCIGKVDKNRHGECMNFAMGFKGQSMHISTHENDFGFIPIPTQEIRNYYEASKETPF